MSVIVANHVVLETAQTTGESRQKINDMQLIKEGGGEEEVLSASWELTNYKLHQRGKFES